MPSISNALVLAVLAFYLERAVPTDGGSGVSVGNETGNQESLMNI